MPATYSRTAKQIFVPVKDLHQKVHWFLIGDVHIGSSCHDERAFKKAQENILKAAERGPIIITFMGDMIHSLLPGDKRYSNADACRTFTSDLTDNFYPWLDPLLAHSNVHWNGYLYGNHEQTICKKNVNPVQLTEHYSKGKIVQYGDYCMNCVTLKFENSFLDIESILTHVAPLNSSRFRDWADKLYRAAKSQGDLKGIDLIAAGHSHDLEILTNDIVLPCRELETDLYDLQYAIRTGSFERAAYNKLERASYIAEKGKPQKVIGYIEIVFSMQMEEDQTDFLDIRKISCSKLLPETAFNGAFKIR